MSRLLASAVMAACLCLTAGCGGSMGSDPSSGGSTPSSPSQPSGGGTAANPPTASVPASTNGSVSATMGAAQTGTLSGKGTGTLTYAISTPPQGGTATITNAATGEFTYTSYPDFEGNDSFQFTVSNGSGTSQPATETINVTSGALGAEQAVANMGVSLDWLCYWCTAQPYVDIVRQASVFGDATTGTPLIEEGKIDSNGWPEADTRIMIACCTQQDTGSSDDPGPENPLIGKYQLSLNGIASIWDDGGKVEDQQYNPATNTTTATLDQTPLNSDGTGFDFLLTFSKTQRTATAAVGSGFTNLQIIRPQFAPNGTKWWDSPSQEFTDPFLASIKGFSTVRYINWTQVIGSPEINWSDRTPANWPVANHLVQAAPAAASYISAPPANCTQYCDWYSTGGSWESVIDVSNATHTDPWINIPVMASDDYVKSLAALFKAELDPGLHVYVEWSDEIWNYGNPYWTETNYAVNHVKALIADDPSEAAKYSANCASWADFECYVAERVLQFANDFSSVYGAAAINTTIRPVLCTQVVQPVFAEEALKFIAASYGPPGNYFYGICGAPYWGASSTLPAGTTAAGAVAAMDQGIPSNNGFLQSDTTIALYYGLHNLTYEGGPNNTSFAVAADSSGQAAKALETAVQTAPGMKNDVIQGLTNAFANGIGMYMFYENESATYWGATVDPLDLGAPKFQGLTTVAGQLVTRTAGTSVPATIPVGPGSFSELGGNMVPGFEATGMYCEAASGSTPSFCGFNGATAVGTGLVVLVNVPTAGNYAISVGMGSGGASAGGLNIEVDQKSVGALTIPSSPGGTPLTLGPVSVSLTAGLHLIEVLNTGHGNYGVDNIVVTGS